MEVESSITSALPLVEVESSETKTFKKVLSFDFVNLSRLMFGAKGYNYSHATES